MKRKRKNIVTKKSNSRRQGATRARPGSRDLGPSRDFKGYGAHPPHAQWPGDARIAVNLNLNVEAGGERCILEGDTASEHVLTDIGFAPYENARSPIVESVFEYGPRVGSWRLLRIFRQFDIKASILGVVRGLQQYPELVDAFVKEGHEIVSHGWRWLDYHHMSEQEEREHIHLAFEGIKALTGAAPVGWFNGRPSINTRRLVIEHGDFLYDRDYLGDELPFWVRHDGRHHLVIPFSFETNDNRFDQNNGFSTADDFATYLNDCFDLLYEEGAENSKDHDCVLARPPHWSASEGGWLDEVSRPRAQARSCLVLHGQGHCRSLVSYAPAEKFVDLRCKRIQGRERPRSSSAFYLRKHPCRDTGCSTKFEQRSAGFSSSTGG